jgi:hypothetical protein
VVAPAHNLCPLTQSPIINPPPSLWLKRKKYREIDPKIGESS